MNRLTFKQQTIIYFLLFAFVIAVFSNVFVFYVSKKTQVSKYLNESSVKFAEKEEYLLSEFNDYKIYLNSFASADMFKKEVYNSNLNKINKILLARTKKTSNYFNNLVWHKWERWLV